MATMNMKTYLPTLLIFFLLVVDKHVSPLPTSSLLKPMKQFGKKGLDVIGVIVDIAANNMQNNPNTQPQVIKGLSSVKSYLYNYGYIRSPSYPPSFTDTMDDDTKLAITNYQSVFKLQTTFPDSGSTVQKMLQPRCSVPDLNLRYTLDDDTNQELSWPKGTSWSPNQSSLTYGFDTSITYAYDANVFRGLFESWSDATKVSLKETNFEDAQIKVMFYDYFNNDRREVAGSTIIQRQPQSSGNNNNVGFIILENGKSWVLPSGDYSQSQGVNLQNVVMHQIGHILGLEHSDDENSIMHPAFDYPQTKVISGSDKQQIKRLSSGQSAAGGNLISDKYQPVGGSSGGSSGGWRVWSSWGLFVATLLIGFSCMALYY